jgi:hypothetical protein
VFPLGDEKMGTYSFLLLITVVLCVSLWAARAYENRRRQAYRKVARMRGLSFSPTVEIDIEKEFRGFRLFSAGAGKRVKNVIYGEVDSASVRVLDYFYRTGGGKSSRKRGQTVLIIHSQKFDLPSFALYPENIVHRIANLFGTQDIDISFHRKFSNSYVLRGKNEEEVRRIFSDDILLYFEGHTGLSVEGRDKRVLFYRNGRLIGPSEISRFLMDGMKVMELFERTGQGKK